MPAIVAVAMIALHDDNRANGIEQARRRERTPNSIGEPRIGRVLPCVMPSPPPTVEVVTQRSARVVDERDDAEIVGVQVDGVVAGTATAILNLRGRNALP